MRILIALHDYLPRHTGGSEIHAHQTAAELVRRGHEVTALFTERDLDSREGTVRRGSLDGVRTLEVVHQREYADVRETWEERASLERFTDLLSELRPAVVHFHHLALWGSGAVRAARAAGARVLVTLHDYHLLCDAATLLRPVVHAGDPDGELCAEDLSGGLSGSCHACLYRHPTLSERWDGLEREAILERAARARFERHKQDLAAAHVILSPSRFLARVFARAGFFPEAACVVLKAGYPGPLFPPRTLVPGRALRVGYVGGIYASKGVHVLVRAFARLRDLPVELHVHGHLDWFPAYVAELRKAAAESRVHFHGPFDPARVDAILAGLDLLVLPSVWYENMPITIHEAHRHGIPVVATDLGGMAEALEHEKTGLLFPRGDERALADAIRRLVTEPGLYERLALGRPRVPTLEEVVDRLEALYAGHA